MEAKVVEATDTSARIRFDGTNPGFVNALRRPLLAPRRGPGADRGPEAEAPRRGDPDREARGRPGPPRVRDRRPRDRAGAREVAGRPRGGIPVHPRPEG